MTIKFKIVILPSQINAGCELAMPFLNRPTRAPNCCGVRPCGLIPSLTVIIRKKATTQGNIVMFIYLFKTHTHGHTHEKYIDNV